MNLELKDSGSEGALQASGLHFMLREKSAAWASEIGHAQENQNIMPSGNRDPKKDLGWRSFFRHVRLYVVEDIVPVPFNHFVGDIALNLI
jgi:hypothetical protein